MNIDEILKKEAIKQVGERGRLIAEVANDFGISNKQLYQWLRESHPRHNASKKERQLSKEMANLRSEIYAMSQQLASLKQQLAKYSSGDKGDVFNFRQVG
ncbi:MAG: transposase [Kangiellaceae bacterium]|nr:transposase [Kangiellaceae bacterium]